MLIFSELNVYIKGVLSSKKMTKKCADNEKKCLSLRPNLLPSK
jgi:hypothetical protein